MTQSPPAAAPCYDRPNWPFVLLTALSLSIGWGIRGNFGHEFGAMIPGALAAMAAVLMSGREDWQRRIAYFGMFGALGWSFGGSMSYMWVVGYTHSGHSPSVLYGFACLFVIGFLWAAPGGAGTALPAVLNRDRLTELFAPASAVFLAWWLQAVWLRPWLLEQGYNLDWFDTDWLAASTAIAAVLLLAIIRRRFDRGTELVLAMACGWWLAFLILVVGLGLRMTPPRGDNWAGCLGLTAGLFWYAHRHRLGGMTLAMILTGTVGGLSFAGACMLKLVEVTSGLQTNWHSVMEQTTGLINGLGIALTLGYLARNAPTVSDTPRLRRWTEPYAIGFVLLLITYLNLRKNPINWVKDRTIPADLYGISTSVWFNLGYLLLAVAILAPLVRHARRPLPLLPASPLGKGQWLYLVLLWWMVVGNFEREIVGFTPQRLITEGVIHVNAVLCTLMLLMTAGAGQRLEIAPRADFAPVVRRAAMIAVVVAALAVPAYWGIVRAIYGDRFAGHSGLHIRFGPNATSNAPVRSP